MVILKNGSKGDDVVTLQRKLKALGFTLSDDGIFGNGTERAVRELQKRSNLKDDGIVGKDTWAVLDTPANVRQPLGESDYQWAAEFLQCNVPSVKAVREVESPAGGYLQDGRVTILYERHIMYRRLLANGYNPDLSAAANPAIVNKTPGGYVGKAGEYNRLDQAKQIDAVSALESCSWGAYQIMGLHWKLLGFSSVYDFVKKMESSERGQLECFVGFIKANPNLLKAIREGDWTAFARGYNGPDYRKNEYDTKLAKAYVKFGGN